MPNILYYTLTILYFNLSIRWWIIHKLPNLLSSKNREDLMKSHIDSLKQKHSELEKRIKSANDNHVQDYNITELKKQKLLLLKVQNITI